MEATIRGMHLMYGNVSQIRNASCTAMHSRQRLAVEYFNFYDHTSAEQVSSVGTYGRARLQKSPMRACDPEP